MRSPVLVLIKTSLCICLLINYVNFAHSESGVFHALDPSEVYIIVNLRARQH